MKLSTGIARIGAGLGATFAVVALSVPTAGAEPSPVNDPDRGSPGETDYAPVLPYEKRLLLHGDLPPVPDTGSSAPAPGPAAEPTTVFIDDDSLELIQIALGAVAGAAVAVGAGVGLSRRQRATPA